MNTPIFEIIGYAASAVTAISLMMKNIRRLRKWNFFGATAFSIYGALIGAWPVFALNGFIALVDIYYLIKMNRNKEYFDLIEINIHKSDFIKRFLNYYKEDIRIYFPDFQLDSQKTYRACFCLRDVRPVSLIIFSTLFPKEMLVEMDYAIPEYRDFKTGKFIYNEGIKRLGLDAGHHFVCNNSNILHERYLLALGFKKTDEKNGINVFKK